MSASDSPPGQSAARLAEKFVRTRFRIVEMMNDDEVVIKAEMKKIRELLATQLQKAMTALEYLYWLLDGGGKDRIHAEMDKMLHDYSETLEAAQQYGYSNDRFSDTSSVQSDK